MTEVHPDPIGDSGQKAAQYVQLLAMAAEAVAVIMAARASAAAERDEGKADSIYDDLLVNHKVAADLWQPVLADDKRDTLDVARTLTAWAAAQAWRETDPDADRASTLAEEHLHELRPAAMTRYDDLRNQGFDPVTAMRQVVPLLETNPRVGDAAPVRAALSRDAALDPDLDEGRMPDTVQVRDPDELNAWHDGYEPPFGPAGYSLKYRVEDRMAPWPQRGFDEDPATPAAHDAMTISSSSAVPDPPALLTVETVLLAEMDAHREAAARATRTAVATNHTAEQTSAALDELRTPRVDEHAAALTQAQQHLVAVGPGGTITDRERDAAQAIAASYPHALTELKAITATAAANAPMDSTTTLVSQRATKMGAGAARN